MAVAHRCELRLANRFGVATGQTIPAVGVSFSVGLGGAGFLSAEVDARAEPVASNPNILDDCVVRVAIPLDGSDTPTEVLAYAPRSRNGVLFDGAGGASRSISSAPTLFTAWAQDAVLYTEANNIPQMSEEQRYFGFQSSIYAYATDPAYTWSAPSTSTGRQDATTGDRAGNPDGWLPELGHAVWITRPAGTPSANSRHLFVTDVTVPTDSYCRILFSADESCAVYAGGQLVIQTSSSETGYQTVEPWSAWILGGTVLRIAIDKTSIVSRGGDGVDPVLLAFFTMNDNESVNTVLKVTDASWRCYALHPVTGTAPSLTPGEILLELHKQAKARGVNTWDAITPTFTKTTATGGTAWGVREERAWRIGHDRYLDMIEGLGDMGVDIEITPQAGTLNLNAYYNRGVDRSATVGVTAINPTAPGATDSIDSITENGGAVTATVLQVETQDGWVPGGLTNAAALATYGRREASLSLGNSPSISQGVRLGQKVLDERLSRPASEWSVEYYATGVVASGAAPFRDFNLGDTIAVTVGGVGVARVVLEIGGQADNVNSIIRWTIKTGPVLT